MALNKYDQTLKLIAQNNFLCEMPHSSMDGEVIKNLIQEGLIKRSGKYSFDLTSYGEIIQIMGYEAHEKKKIKSEFPRKEKKKNKTFFFIVLILVVVILLIVLFTRQ